MKYLISFFVAVSFSFLATAQIVGPTNDQFNSIRQNGVSSIEAFGDTVWISPSLNRNIDNRPEWFTPENADSVVDGVGRVFSLTLGQDTVVAGLGFSVENADAGGTVPAGYGFYFSTDGGENWRFSEFPTDPDPGDDCDRDSESYDPDCDIQFTYGGKTYNRVRTTVKEQSPPYETDFKGNTVFAAAWGSGLIRSTDFGTTWERVILPPSVITDFNPNGEYTWNSVADGVSINRYDPTRDNNLLGFGLLIDSKNRVWFGSAGGINVSENALTAPTDSIAWKHYRFDNTSDGLLGEWIISIKEQPGTGNIWMTNWISTPPQKQGIVFTDDGGLTFTQMLVGERINDIGFKDGFVFATGDNGLFVSKNNGTTWIKLPPIKSANTFIKPSAQYYTAAATTDRIWIGTSDGIASHLCCQPDQLFNNWQITRVDYPLSGGNIHDPDGRNTDSYAYPNPFSTSLYDLVRIKFNVESQANLKVRIFDFGMNLVREINGVSGSAGTYEAVWDGYDGKGRKVANGPYIYVAKIENGQMSGKILVIE